MTWSTQRDVFVTEKQGNLQVIIDRGDSGDLQRVVNPVM